MKTVKVAPRTTPPTGATPESVDVSKEQHMALVSPGLAQKVIPLKVKGHRALVVEAEMINKVVVVDGEVDRVEAEDEADRVNQAAAEVQAAGEVKVDRAAAGEIKEAKEDREDGEATEAVRAEVVKEDGVAIEE
ncbi:unnamed protein product, partial [Nippostrongylus brasiliensis]|uniref:DUF2382 domain-containing protein n=1 Tax=Nippostrongylus brasiliensis TaxID=27835 RepID=A0A0N4YRK1_NIPBR